jgi:O-antigen ligase
MTFQNKVLLPGLFFRAARIFLLVLVIILPWEAVTAAREIAMALAAVFLALDLAFSKERGFRPGPLFWPLVLYALAASLSLIWAVDFSYSLRELRAEVLKGLVIFYTGFHFLENEDNARHLWITFLVGLAIMVVAGIVLFFVDGGSLANHAVRAGSLHNGYGSLSTYLVTVWPFLFLAPKVLKLPKPWFTWSVFFGLTLFLVFITYSRSAWLAISAQSCLGLFLLSKNRLRAALVLIVGFFLVVVVLFNLPGSRHGESWDALLEEQGQVGGTTGDLITLWRFSYEQLKQRPFQGIGLGRHSFSKSFPEFRRTHQPLLWHAHNMFVDLALQTGVQGLFAILLVFAVLVWCLWPNSPPANGNWLACFAMVGLLSVLGYAMRNLSDDFFCDDSSLMFWLVAGLALAARQARRKYKRVN